MAPADNIDSNTAMAVCIYCGSAFYLEGDDTISLGPCAIKDDESSFLYTGATGTIEDRKFTITGRLSYEVSGGQQNLWCLFFEDEHEISWLMESEDEFHLREDISRAESIPSFKSLELESRFEIAGSIVTVEEKNKALLHGAEGSLPFIIKKGTIIPFIEASFDDDAVTIEYIGEPPRVYKTRHMDLSEIFLDISKDELEDDYEDGSDDDYEDDDS
jgi:hypothetical protein